MAAAVQKELWSFFRDRKSMEKINRLHKAIMESATRCGGFAVYLSNTDDDPANDLFSAAEAYMCPDGVTQERGLCLDHQTQHSIIWAVMCNLTLVHMSTFYAISSFVGTGTHLYRFDLG